MDVVCETQPFYTQEEKFTVKTELEQDLSHVLMWFRFLMWAEQSKCWCSCCHRHYCVYLGALLRSQVRQLFLKYYIEQGEYGRQEIEANWPFTLVPVYRMKTTDLGTDKSLKWSAVALQ